MRARFPGESPTPSSRLLAARDGQVVDGADLNRRQEEEGHLPYFTTDGQCQSERVNAALQPITGDRLLDCFVAADGVGLEVYDDEAVFFFEEPVDEAFDGAVADGGADVVGLAE